MSSDTIREKIRESIQNVFEMEQQMLVHKHRLLNLADAMDTDSVTSTRVIVIARGIVEEAKSGKIHLQNPNGRTVRKSVILEIEREINKDREDIDVENLYKALLKILKDGGVQ